MSDERPLVLDADLDAKRRQVAAQYRAVAHLCKQIGHVHEQLAALHEGGHSDQLLDTVGTDTAARMEVLGDLANDMDIITDEDAWLNPIFEDAHRRWPTRAQEEADLERAGATLAAAYQAVGILVMTEDDKRPSDKDQTQLLDLLSRWEAYPRAQIEAFLPWPKEWVALEPRTDWRAVRESELQYLGEVLNHISGQFGEPAQETAREALGWLRKRIAVREQGPALSDDALRALWLKQGGEFHGPNVETGTMPEANLLPFLRSLLGTVVPTRVREERSEAKA